MTSLQWVFGEWWWVIISGPPPLATYDYWPFEPYSSLLLGHSQVTPDPPQPQDGAARWPRLGLRGHAPTRAVHGMITDCFSILQPSRTLPNGSRPTPAQGSGCHMRTRISKLTFLMFYSIGDSKGISINAEIVLQTLMNKGYKQFINYVCFPYRAHLYGIKFLLNPNGFTNFMPFL